MARSVGSDATTGFPAAVPGTGEECHGLTGHSSGPLSGHSDPFGFEGELIVDLAVGSDLGGVTIVPGDWVHIDAAGLVVVPAVDRDAVLEAAVIIEDADATAVTEIRRRGRQARA
jgi:hypothetical protein